MPCDIYPLWLFGKAGFSSNSEKLPASILPFCAATSAWLAVYRPRFHSECVKSSKFLSGLSKIDESSTIVHSDYSLSRNITFSRKGLRDTRCVGYMCLCGQGFGRTLLCSLRSFNVIIVALLLHAYDCWGRRRRLKKPNPQVLGLEQSLKKKAVVAFFLVLGFPRRFFSSWKMGKGSSHIL